MGITVTKVVTKTVVECDRCGEKHDCEGMSETAAIDTVRKRMWAQIAYSRHANEPRSMWICPACVSEFWPWLNQKRIEARR